MSKIWLRAAAAALLALYPLICIAAVQSLYETVQSVTSALSSTANLVCSEKRTLSRFRGPTMLSKNVYEYVIAAPRTIPSEQGDRRTAYAELVRLNGKPAPKSSPDSNITVAGTISDGGTSIFRNQRGYFDFSLVDSATQRNEPNLLVEFQLKRTSPPPSTLPDFGKALIDKTTRHLVRLERTFLGITQSAGPSYQNAETTIVENYGSVVVDGSPVRMVKTWNMRVTERADRNMVRTFESEYSNCHRFEVSVTVKPVR